MIMGRIKRRPNDDDDNESTTDDDDDSYRVRRERNNIAVRKSREKSRAKARLTAQRVADLRHENTELETRIGTLSKELKLLKDLLLTRAGKKPAADVTDDVEVAAAESKSAADKRSRRQLSTDSIQQDHMYISSRPRR